MEIIVLLFLIAVGIFVLYVSLKYMTLDCPNNVIYKYIPRTLEEEMKSPVKPSEIFKNLFERQSPFPMARP